MPTADTAPAARLILASTSRYRAELLQRLGLPFDNVAPVVDETPHAGEAPAALAARLALAKATAVAQRSPHHWVLGSDQVCACDGSLLGKPGTLPRAREQLRKLAGRSAEFYTSVALIHGATACTLAAVDITCVRLRPLQDAEIERYLATEPALDCAGSFKCEGLGISLCEAIDSQDPTALIGLPLIAVRRLLAEAGFDVP